MVQRVRVCMHVMRDIVDDVRLRRSATALAEAGWHVTVVDISAASGHMLNDSSLRSPGAGAPYAVQHVTTTPDFRSQRFTGRNGFQILHLVIRTTLALLRQRADIYHACEWTALPACYVAAMLHRKPLIFEAYELPLQDHPDLNMRRGRRMLYAWIQLFLLYVLPRCAAVITVSPPIVHAIQRRYHRAHVTLIRNIPHYHKAPPTQQLRDYLHLSEHTRIALYQGNLQPDRRLDRLVLAAAYLEPGCLIVMMGQNIGTTQAELEQLIARQHLHDSVKIIPAVPYTSLPAWTASADVGLLITPLDATLNMTMSLPNKLFEYIQAGLPVLASPLPAVREILSSYGVGRIVRSMAPADIGAAINALLYDPVTRERMHDNALQAARQDLYWEKESQYLIKLYQQVRPMI